MKKKDKEEHSEETEEHIAEQGKEEYVAKEDCVIFHNNTVFAFQKGNTVKDKEVIEIMKLQGLITGKNA